MDALLGGARVTRAVVALPAFPPVLEDLAVVVDEGVPAVRVQEVIREAGGTMVADVRQFDLFRGDQIGPGKKSLAYAITYQASDRTLTDDEVLTVRQRIVRQLEADVGGQIRA
jgi:phenylalanyl-tRNA synthetase beta chain